MEWPAPRAVSDCCGAAVTRHAGKADAETIPGLEDVVVVCTECRTRCEEALRKVVGRSCPQCWRHLDLRDWKGCKDRFCVPWEECRPLTPEEAKVLEEDVNRRPFR